MLKFKNESLVPKGGKFSYIQPESQLLIEASALEPLIEKVRFHRLANNYPIPANFREQVVDGVCQRLASQGFPSWCYDPSSPMIEPSLYQPSYPRPTISLTDVERGTKTILANIAAGAATVSQQEAERRASICSKCDRNVEMSGCRACGAAARILELANKYVKGKVLSNTYRLQSCSVCKCYLRAKVWFPMDDLRKYEPQQMRDSYPDWCWLK